MKKALISIHKNFTKEGYSFGMRLKEENNPLPIDDLMFNPPETSETDYFPNWAGELDLYSLKQIKEFIDNAIEEIEKENL